MLTAAAAWNGLAIELRSQATNYSSVISNLTAEGWRGPASTAMAAAAAPYTAWMNTTAAQAEQTANQAVAAASAYEAAFGMTVPPPVIAANRSQLASLVATNLLGQNTPAIAATEAQYGEMWAQDAAAMYGYAAQSATATKVPSFTTAPQTTTTGVLAGQAAATTQATGTSASTSTGRPVAVAADTSAVPTHAAVTGVADIVDFVVFGDVLDVRGLRASWSLLTRRLLRELSTRQLLEHLGTGCKHLEHLVVDRGLQPGADQAPDR